RRPVAALGRGILRAATRRGTWGLGRGKSHRRARGLGSLGRAAPIARRLPYLRPRLPDRLARWGGRARRRPATPRRRSDVPFPRGDQLGLPARPILISWRHRIYPRVAHAWLPAEYGVGRGFAGPE